jgi:hypothetical protein
MCVGYKNHDKKSGGQHRIRLVCAGCCVWVQALAVACAVDWVDFVQQRSSTKIVLLLFVFTMGFKIFTTDDILLHRPATRQYYLLCILRCCLHIYVLLSIELFVNHIALTML